MFEGSYWQSYHQKTTTKKLSTKNNRDFKNEWFLPDFVLLYLTPCSSLQGKSGNQLKTREHSSAWALPQEVESDKEFCS